MSVLKKLKFILIVMTFLLSGHKAYAVFDFLSCDKHQIKDYQKQCSPKNHCGYTENTKDPLAKSCFNNKVKSCYCLTFIGARDHRTPQFNFQDFKIHGNFCGWRNAATEFKDKPLNWNNSIDSQKATILLSSVDNLDQVCKQHDIDYGRNNRNICHADSKAITSMIKISQDRTEPKFKRELALALAQSLKKNSISCYVMNLIW